ncbi:hypothetical protein V1478_011321 [Vespula squamosa]|uniref:Uncharacterized protein n=1 Tax=Vespula squamosa TaxID=30214 RepID=A0ABD2AE65_VESSQ
MKRNGKKNDTKLRFTIRKEEESTLKGTILAISSLTKVVEIGSRENAVSDSSLDEYHSGLSSPGHKSQTILRGLRRFEPSHLPSSPFQPPAAVAVAAAVVVAVHPLLDPPPCVPEHTTELWIFKRKHIVDSTNDTIDHYTAEGTKQGDPNKYLNVAHESLIGSRHEHFFLRSPPPAGSGLIWKTGSPRS